MAATKKNQLLLVSSTSRPNLLCFGFDHTQSQSSKPISRNGYGPNCLIPQGKLTGSPNYSGFSNNLMIPINCESLKAIGEMACITPARFSLGQTLKYILSSKLSWRGSEIISDLFWVVVQRFLAIFLRNFVCY